VDKFVAKSLRSCTAFLARREDGFYTLLDRSYQGGALDQLLRRPDELLAGGEILKDGNSATVVKINIDGRDLVVKRYNIKNFTHALRRCLRPSRAFVSWKMGQRLCWWRIATPKPVAMLEKRSLGLRSTAYFISEYVGGSLAYDYLRRPDISSEELDKWLQQFTILLTQLRNLGLSHGDFKATNFLCGNDSRLYLLDLDAMRSWARPESGFKVAVSRDYRRLLANWQNEPEIELAFQRIIEKLSLQF
jgi:tRNA A-37 threonylcarbamoyl transferase component Bud32